MLTRMLFLSGLVLCGCVVLTGAWPASFAPLAPDADSAFVSKAIPLDADIIGSGINARQLLEKALGKLAAKDTAWLNTKIRQTVYDAAGNFTAEGFLQRGPNQCARMELEITAKGGRSRLVIVSDGEVVAQVQKPAAGKSVAEVDHLPAITPKTAQADREAFLDAKSCGGPAALLRPIHQHLQDARLQTGLLNGEPVIQLKAELDPDKFPAFSARKLAALSACVCLDAKTLWPVRVEWSGAENHKPVRLLAVIEFREPTIGVALAEEECTRMFSYEPDGSEHVKEVRRR